MNTDVKFKPAVSVDQALTCLAPLSDYFGWTKTDILTNQLEGGCEIHVIARDGGIQHLSIYLRGEVSYSFSDLVQSFAEQVGPLAKPGFITLRDYDSGDLVSIRIKTAMHSHDITASRSHTKAVTVSHGKTATMLTGTNEIGV